MERWEPTEILAVPIPLDPLKSVTFHASASISILSLLFFALESLFLDKKTDKKGTDGSLLVEDPHHQSPSGKMTPSAIQGITIYNVITLVANYFISTTLMQFIIFLVVVLSGASPVENLHHTLLASAYLSNMMFSYIPPNHERLSLFHSISNVFMAFSKFNNIESGQEHNQSSFNMMQKRITELNAFILYSIIGVLCPCMILNILDHGEQYQRWPFPIILAALIGHVIGATLGLLFAWVNMYRTGNLSLKLHNV